MPTGTFTQAWMDTATKQGPIRRMLMRSIARNPSMMKKLEAEATARAKEQYGDRYGAVPWDIILTALLPLLMKFLEALLAGKK